MVGRQNADIADTLQLRDLQSPTYRFSDSGRLLYFGRVIYLFSFPSTDFSTSLGRFSRNFATRRGMC